MRTSLVTCVVLTLASGAALAQGKSQQQQPPAGAAANKPGQSGQAPGAGTATAQQPGGDMDMSKMGPWTRKPTNEGQTLKEIMAFFKAMEESMKKGDFEADLARVDFPVHMLTDDAKGVPSAKLYTREEYVAMMKPFYESSPKDMKTTHKPTVSVLSDSLVAVVDDFTMTMGKQSLRGRNFMLLVKKDGQWKRKQMTEAGWGGMEAPSGAAGSGTK
jgi:hypothetical protein